MRKDVEGLIGVIQSDPIFKENLLDPKSREKALKVFSKKHPEYSLSDSEKDTIMHIAPWCDTPQTFAGACKDLDLLRDEPLTSDERAALFGAWD